MYLFIKAWECPEMVKGKTGTMRIPRFTYIAPTYRQAKDIAWDLLKSIVPEQALLKKPNETQLEIRLINRVILNLKGADKEDTLRGPGLQFALLDEFAFMKENVWDGVIRPELGATGGDAMFIGTPSGRNHFYKVFKLGRDGIRGWKSWHLPATRDTLNFTPDTPRGQELLSEGFLESQKIEMTEKFYLQEYECEFSEKAGVVFDRIDENTVDEFREFPEAGHRYRIGVDPALREDWTAIVVLDLTDWKVKYVYRTNKIDVELLEMRIGNVANTWTTDAGRAEIVMDTTGMGDPIYEHLLSNGVTVTPVQFGGRVAKGSVSKKRKMVDNLSMMFQKDEIKIPRVDWLLDELKDYGYERLPSGVYRYGAPPGHHDDGVTALYLACWDLPPKQLAMVRQSSGGTKKFNKFTGCEV